VGAAILVNGRVTEFRAGCTPSCTPPDFPAGNFGASAFANLSITEIDRATVAPAGTGAITPTVVGEGGRVPPTTVIDNDTPDPQADDPPLMTGNVESKSGAPLDSANQDPTFDPSEDGIDFYESLEGTLTQVNRAVVVAPTNTFSVGAANENSELAVLADNGEHAGLRTDRGAAEPVIVRQLVVEGAHKDDFNPERIILNDPVARDSDEAAAPEAQVGDNFADPIEAVVDYSFGNYKFLARRFPALEDGGLTPESAPPAGKHDLSVASYNVETSTPSTTPRASRPSRVRSRTTSGRQTSWASRRCRTSTARVPAGRPATLRSPRWWTPLPTLAALHTSTARSTPSTTRRAERRTRASASVSCSGRIA
jgi:hypothetical protein